MGETGAEGIKDANVGYGVKVNNALTSALTTEDQQAKTILSQRCYLKP